MDCKAWSVGFIVCSFDSSMYIYGHEIIIVVVFVIIIISITTIDNLFSELRYCYQ